MFGRALRWAGVAGAAAALVLSAPAVAMAGKHKHHHHHHAPSTQGTMTGPAYPY